MREFLALDAAANGISMSDRAAEIFAAHYKAAANVRPAPSGDASTEGEVTRKAS